MNDFHDDTDGVEIFEDAIRREHAAAANDARRIGDARADEVEDSERDEAMREAWEATKPEEEIMPEESTAAVASEAEMKSGPEIRLIHKAIAGIMEDLVPIAKGRRNAQQGYSFRGIDDIYNALHPLMAKYRIYCLPEVLDREVQERTTQRGGTLLYTRLKVRFVLVCSEDGSSVQGVVEGEAMDSGDKSSNKAMSAAMKYFYLIVFAIPTEGENDADATTPPDTRPRREAQQQLSEEAKSVFDRKDAEASQNTSAPGLPELLELCDRFALKDMHKDAWCKHFKVTRLEDLAEEHIQAIIAKIKKMHGQQN